MSAVRRLEDLSRAELARLGREYMLYGHVYDRALILSRPDRHVAWRGDTLPSDPLALIDRVRGATSDDLFL